jgi:hypothetical protein
MASSTNLAFDAPKKLKPFLVGHFRVHIIRVNPCHLWLQFGELHVILEPLHHLVQPSPSNSHA